MRSKPWIPLLFAALLLAAAPALADEILHFTNGTTMPVKAHTVVGKMIHVELDSSSYMAFPLSQIEKVTREGEEVELVHSVGERNRMAAAHAATEATPSVASTSGEQPKTMEEKLSAYTRAARGEAQAAANAPPRAGMSNSATAMRSIELNTGGDGRDAKDAALGSTPNLSGRRLGLLRASPRKTVGGTTTLQRALPNSSRVELVGKQPVKSGGSGSSSN